MSRISSDTPATPFPRSRTGPFRRPLVAWTACTLFGLAGSLAGCAADLDQPAVFPRRPIKIIVYTGPGGLIDVTARHFAEIASRHTQATFVVENHPGAGGLIATKRVLQLPADGYTLYACTKSNISKLVAAGGRSFIDSMDWIAMLIADPECIITRAGSTTSTWQQVLADAQARPGGQIWLGPDSGGLDHVMAMKTWDRCGITAKWIPYKSGGEAKAALLGDQGAVYVGNPSDVLGNPQFTIAAVSSPSRLKQLPDVPTLGELGIEGLDTQYMWRGFAVKRGTPPAVLAWYEDLFRRVTGDPEWRALWEKSGIEVLYHGSDRFTATVREDERDFAYYLSRIGIVQTASSGLFARVLEGWGFAVLAAGIVVVAGVLVMVAGSAGFGDRAGQIAIPAVMLGICLLFLAATFVLPENEAVGPAAMPRLWIGLMLPVCAGLLVQGCRGRHAEVQRRPRVDLVAWLAALLAGYVVGIPLLGYVMSSALFLPLAMLVLGERSFGRVGLVTFIWVVGSYLIFVRLLYVPLPAGRVWEGLL